MRTAGEPATLKLTPDRRTIKADGMDLSYVLVEAYDKAGNPCPLAMNTLDISVTGVGQIAAIGNGDPQSLDPFQGSKVKLFYGKAIVIIKGGSKPGDAKITVSTAGIEKALVTLKVE